ncbi:hypothetical protein ACFPL7_17745 [Dongia soli]|uniref:Uncharacterized protein n=1 Tax=Dongia soli TaxID=600628 RepID=A0ABU5E6D6_9PROT|nr:hypothetical protein [Dongia soli]MDY0881436.1 hypothetical protein [Dongia soli]
MSRKKPKTKDSPLLSFDIIYEDGSRSSNRKIHSDELDYTNELASAKAALEAQDRKISELSGRPRPAIKSLMRSNA